MLLFSTVQCSGAIATDDGFMCQHVCCRKHDMLSALSGQECSQTLHEAWHIDDKQSIQ